MHVLVLIVFASLLASTAHAGAGIPAGLVPNGPVGCSGKLIVEPKFKKGDIE